MVAIITGRGPRYTQSFQQSPYCLVCVRAGITQFAPPHTMRTPWQEHPHRTGGGGASNGLHNHCCIKFPK